MSGAGIRIDVTVQDQALRAALAELIAKVQDPAPALLEIGEELFIWSAAKSRSSLQLADI
ncbi:hypothetical protein [Candidatus Thiodictyon syntrophicum]|jgi:hypothetical protein|uniref:Uncharacterized protein n=1 Tax=Candidatus Thiodictyon syntrophicum TaxID=1166950 RepID=A0A2K8U9A0_9GAMM|nr:hypothetical protein [Candidatus Thiodictyon syntrophicum]AUB81611.1 hypothetical protein THSYN_12005 [Candidatus Thiodictyon syntrophicum]